MDWLVLLGEILDFECVCLNLLFLIHALGNICSENGEIDPECFKVAQKFVFETLENRYKCVLHCVIVSYVSCDQSDTEFASCYPNTVITSHSVYFLFLFHKEIENGEKNTKPDANTQGSLGEFEIT